MREQGTDRLFYIVNYVILSLLLLITVFPLLHIVAASISDPLAVNRGQVWLWPKNITLEGYRRVLQDAEIWSGYRNTILYTVAGTILNLVLTFTSSYALSRRDLAGRQFFMLLILFTMFFGGGLIPTYFLVRNLGLLDTFWALIVPGAVSAWNIIIVRTYMQTEIPQEIHEAAKIDGCSDWSFFGRVVLPLSKPIMAVMALFYGVGHWNAFFDALIYLTDRTLYPLQLILRELLVQAQMSESMKQSGGVAAGLAQQAQLAELLKYAMIIISTAPVLAAYPLLQRFFVKGIMVGSVKG